MFIRKGKLFKMPSNAYRAWHDDASWQLKGQKGSSVVTRCRMEIDFYLPDARKTDLTNKAESIMDMLVDNGVLEDDNCNVVRELTLRYNGIDRVNPRAEIHIK